jgi:MFS family permease
MTLNSTASSLGGLNESLKKKLLLASFLTLIAAGIGFAVRGGILGSWSAQFGFTMLELGTITGGGLVGFGVVILLTSLITDRIGYKSILILAGVLQIASYLLTVAAGPIYAAMGKDATYQCLYWGMFMFSVSCGLCECVINPLVATLYPDKKTHYLNILHAGWPAGLVLGSLIGIVMGGTMGLSWQVQLSMFLIPVIWYFIMVVSSSFPKSEASAAGVGFGEMLLTLASPILLLLLFLHACVGYVELGTDSWISNITNNITGGQGLYLFMYASIMMFILRFFAGPIVERINPLGLLCVSAALGCTGLFFLGSVQSVFMAWVAVTVYSLGKTFLWPTMLGVVGERFPKGGAIAMGALGGIGMLSAGLLGGPGIGYKQDYFASHQLKEASPATYERYAAAGENGFLMFPAVKGLDGSKVGVLLDDGKGIGAEVEILKKANTYENDKNIKPLNEWWQAAQVTKADDKAPVESARLHGGQMALKYTALIPGVLFLGYLLLLLYFKSRGGYKPVVLGAGGKET